MKRQLTIIIFFLVAVVSFSVVAVDWKELEWSATVVSDYKTGLPAITFSLGLAYDVPPETMQLSIAWEVFRVDDGSETMLYEYARTTAKRAAIRNIWTASQSVLLEAGSRYGARVQIDDLENDLSYKRTFSHIEPHSLPVGLRFVGWDGTEEADLAAMTDEAVNELVLLKKAIASYEVIAENVSISTLFSQYATTDTEYPVSIILLPETGVDNNWGSDSKPITVTFGLAVLTFSIPNISAGSGFQQQLVQTFNGTIYAGSDGEGPSEGVIVFLHDAMGVILDAAVDELAARDD